MELIVRIQEQGALQEREYQNKQTGAMEKFASMLFLLTHGGDSIVAEAIQEQARKQGTLSKDYYYLATLQMQARPWTDQNGVQRYETRVTITKLTVL